jgi:hypothetical protein
MKFRIGIENENGKVVTYLELEIAYTKSPLSSRDRGGCGVGIKDC